MSDDTIEYAMQQENKRDSKLYYYQFAYDDFDNCGPHSLVVMHEKKYTEEEFNKIMKAVLLGSIAKNQERVRIDGDKKKIYFIDIWYDVRDELKEFGFKEVPINIYTDFGTENLFENELLNHEEKE